MRLFSILVLILFIWSPVIFGVAQKGLKVVNIKDQQGKTVGHYTGSYALLIGVSDYTSGWPDLESIASELSGVQNQLDALGFQVRRVANPTSKMMKRAFEDFIDDYGYQKDNQLLFYFSGHGYTLDEGQRGYLVPSDAPDPRKDLINFRRKSLDMSQILSWSRQMVAKHSLFLFDSCFSGTIFKTKALPQYPPHINILTSKPVRQFITAGSAGEEVPAQSVFTPLFVRALQGSADLNRDSYVTGTELGMFLSEKVIYYKTGQTPQYGKIRDPNLDEGDFVFRLKTSVAPPEKKFFGREELKKDRNQYLSSLLSKTVEAVLGSCKIEDRNISRIISVGARALFGDSFLLCPYIQSEHIWCKIHQERNKKIHNYLVSLNDNDIVDLVRFVKTIKWLPVEHIKKELIRVTKELESPYYLGDMIVSFGQAPEKIKRDPFGRMIYSNTDCPSYDYLEGENASYTQKFFFRQGPIFYEKFLLAAKSFLSSDETFQIQPPDMSLKELEAGVIAEETWKGLKIIKIKSDLYQLFKQSTNWRNNLKPKYDSQFVENVNGFSKIALSEWLSETMGRQYYFEGDGDIYWQSDY
jgi:hypothetical protein